MFLSAVVLQVGDVLTQVESVDEQWIMGVVGEKRGIVPKNYISLLWAVSQQEVDSVNRSVNTCHTCQHLLQRFSPQTFQVFVLMCIQQPALFWLAAELEERELWGVIRRLMESNWRHAGDFCRPVGFSFLPVSRLDWIWLFLFPPEAQSQLWTCVNAADRSWWWNCWTDVSQNCFIQCQNQKTWVKTESCGALSWPAAGQRIVTAIVKETQNRQDVGFSLKPDRKHLWLVVVKLGTVFETLYNS